jgi:ABC-type oligopeptide transport system ATPase subunit
MNLRLIVAILVIAAVPVSVQAQRLSTAKATKAGARKVVEMISGDKAKIQTYCDIGELADLIGRANQKKDAKKADEFSQKMDELGKELGPEYVALMDGLPEIDPQSEDGEEIGSMLQTLEKLCAG